MPVLVCTSSWWQINHAVKPREEENRSNRSKSTASGTLRPETKNRKTRTLDPQDALGEKVYDNLRGFYTRACKKWFREGRHVDEPNRVSYYCKAHDKMIKKEEEEKEAQIPVSFALAFDYSHRYIDDSRVLSRRISAVACVQEELNGGGLGLALLYLRLSSMKYRCEVSGAHRTPGVNGIYKAVGVRNGAIKFKKKEPSTTHFTRVYEICLAKVKRTGVRKWYISRTDRNEGINKDQDYYNVEFQASRGFLPPSAGWKMVLGDKPLPRVNCVLTKPTKLQTVLFAKHFDEKYMIDMFKRRPEIMINRFPGMKDFCTKANLTTCIEHVRKKHPKEAVFYPRSWVLDSTENIAKFRSAFDTKKCYILKPDGGLQGIGISLCMTWKQVEEALQRNRDLEEQWERERNDPDLAEKRVQNVRIARENNELAENSRHLGHLIAQEYISKPALIDSTKFDMRIYVMVKSLKPLKAVVMKEGLARFCTTPYQPPTSDNITNAYMHLTNYHLNVTNEHFQNPDSKDGKAVLDSGKSTASKRSLQMALSQLNVDRDRFWRQIQRMVSISLIAMLPQLRAKFRKSFPDGEGAQSDPKASATTSPTNGDAGARKSSENANARASNGGGDEKSRGSSMQIDGKGDEDAVYVHDKWQRCFQIMGFDVMLDADRNAYLLEINDHPSLKAPSPLDKVIKAAVLRTTLALVDPDCTPIKSRKNLDFPGPPARNSKVGSAAADDQKQEDGGTAMATQTKLGRLEMEFLEVDAEAEYKSQMPEMFDC
eukprot:jgi/Bigna1/90140/estExt_fgenesh1_pg.C_630056